MAGGGESFMDDKLYEAARISTHEIPSPADTLYYLKTTPGDESNALHVAAKHGNHKFIEVILSRVDDTKEILCKLNSKGQTPLHIAAESGSMEAVKAILEGHDAIIDDAGKVACWRERDKGGNTPVHIALRFGHEEIALLMMEKDMEYLVALNNNMGESLAFLAAENLCTKFLTKIVDVDRTSNCSVSFSGPFGQTAFHPSSKLTVDIMSSLIERRVHLLKAQDNDGKTVLHYAVEEDNMEMVNRLLDADSSLAYFHDKNGLTPLHRAASMGSIPMISTIINLSPQSILIRDKLHGNTALHVSKMDAVFITKCLQETRMMELINEVNYEGNTLLHLVLLNSNFKTAEVLLKVSGINWRLKNMKGHTPMQLCKSEDEIPTKLKYLATAWKTKQCADMEMLYDITNLDDLFNHFTDWGQILRFKGPGGNSIFHLAARDGNMKTIEQLARHSSEACRMLLSEKNEKGETPLHLAAEFGNLRVVKAIRSVVRRIQTDLSSAIDAENGKVSEEPWICKSINGDTPAHKSIRNGHQEIAVLLLRLEPQLASDAYVNKQNESLLYLAADTSSLMVVKRILSASTQFPYSICGPNGKNPLHAVAASSSRALIRWSAGPQLLTKQPALSKMVDNDGKTPLHYAVENSSHALLSRLIEENKSAAFIYDNDGLTPLLRAAKCGSYFSVEVVLRHCPMSAELRDVSNDKTLLHLFKSSVRIYDLLRCLRIRSMPKLINETDRDGNTPLHCAVLDGDKAKVFALLECKGINWNIRNKQGQTPLDISQQLKENGNEIQREIYGAFDFLFSRRVSFVEVVVSLISMVTYLGSRAKMLEEEELKQLMNNLALVATLLVTLTFAALFTIPGGYDQNTGIPLRMGQVAIQVFVASDALAMLLGVAVLMVYLSIISSGYRVSRLRRFASSSINLLQWSIQFTLVAFLCGMYALCSGHAVAFWVFSLSVFVVAGVEIFAITH